MALNRSHLEASLAWDDSNTPMSTRIGPFATSAAHDPHQVQLPGVPDPDEADEMKDDPLSASLCIGGDRRGNDIESV